MSRFLVAVLATFFVVGALAGPEVVQFSICEDEVNSCDIHEVKIDPCKEAANDEPCKVRRGKKHSMFFDYTPKFSGDSLSVRAYWTGGVTDLPFAGMNTNGCEYTTCPATAGVKNSFAYSLDVSKDFPARVYDVKWKLWNDAHEQCCFITRIKLM